MLIKNRVDRVFVSPPSLNQDLGVRRLNSSEVEINKNNFSRIAAAIKKIQKFANVANCNCMMGG